jgi:hypothetical protein
MRDVPILAGRAPFRGPAAAGVVFTARLGRGPAVGQGEVTLS